MLSIEYYKMIQMIEDLFDNNTYIKKNNKNSNYIEINITKIDNKDYKYIVKIYSTNNDIEITIPINNSNYNFKTILYDINSVYNYLYLHTNIFTQ